MTGHADAQRSQRIIPTACSPKEEKVGRLGREGLAARERRNGGPCRRCEAARKEATEAKRLVCWLAHELRTPLNGVLGYAEMLCETLGELDHPALRADAERVTAIARHQLVLLDDLLELSRLEQGCLPLRLEPVDVLRSLGEVADATRPLVERGGNRLVVAAGTGGLVLADRTRLRQVLLNLASNAARFTRGGAVTLEAAVGEGSISIRVRDTGRGMTEEEAARIFTPFQQANAGIVEEFGGSGLGLSISKELCDRMGGTISVSSVPGKGSAFTVTLPAAPRRSGWREAARVVR